MNEAERLAKLAQWSAAATEDFIRVCGVAPGRWLQLERELGTHGACQHLLRPHPESYWVPILTHAFERDRLRWTVEAAALTPEFAPLFSDGERAVARERLVAFGYPVP